MLNLFQPRSDTGSGSIYYLLVRVCGFVIQINLAVILYIGLKQVLIFAKSFVVRRAHCSVYSTSGAEDNCRNSF